MVHNKVGILQSVSYILLLLQIDMHVTIQKRDLSIVHIISFFNYELSVNYVVFILCGICSFDVDGSHLAGGNHVLHIESKGHAVQAFLNNELIGLLLTLTLLRDHHQITIQYHFQFSRIF